MGCRLTVIKMVLHHECVMFGRLRSEVEKQESQHKETFSQLQNRHAAEVAELTEQLLEAENMRATYEKEVRYVPFCPPMF